MRAESLADALCGDIAVGGVPSALAGGGVRRAPAAPPGLGPGQRSSSQINQDIWDRIQERQIFPAPENGGARIQVDKLPEYPYSERNHIYRDEHTGPDLPDYPIDYNDPDNYYSPYNRLGPNYKNWNLPGGPDGSLPPNVPEPADVKGKAGGKPTAPSRARPPAPDLGGVISDSLIRLCEHWRTSENNPSLPDQIRAAIDANCTDPTGQPDPTGRLGGACGGFTVERIGDVQEMIGAGESQPGSDGRVGEFEPTTVIDRLGDRARRNWEMLDGLVLSEPCNPLICRPGDVQSGGRGEG
jgi:hypothetical protein